MNRITLEYNFLNRLSYYHSLMPFFADKQLKNKRLLHLLLLIPVFTIIIWVDISLILDEEFILVEGLESALLYTGFCGVLGFVFRVQFISRKFWQAIFILDFADNLYGIYSSLLNGDIFFYDYTAILALSFIIFAFYYYILFWLYAFDSYDIWVEK